MVDPNFGKTTLSQINEASEVLVEVQVSRSAYLEVKGVAEEKLMDLYTSGEYATISGEAQNILVELATVGYIWYPNISRLAFHGDDELRLAGYILAARLRRLRTTRRSRSSNAAQTLTAVSCNSVEGIRSAL